MIDKQEIIKYAELVIKKGINLQKNQCLLIGATYHSYEFARLLANVAYQQGAKYVKIDIADKELLKSRIKYSTEENLTYVQNALITNSLEMVAEKWAKIRIDSTEEIDTLADIDPNKVATVTKTLSSMMKVAQESTMKNQQSWCVICYPGPKWAKKILGDNATEMDLWNYLKSILRLDKPDPLLAWQKNLEKIELRAEKLNDLNIEKIILTNKNSKIEFSLTKTSIWDGGGGYTPDGTYFIANIPTEEVFTTPHYAKTSGYVKATKPVNVMGNPVEEAYFEFKNGKVTKFDAKKGKNFLEQFLTMDEQASFVGELALVDINSPIHQANLTFHSILYDENASCHIALGAGYPSCLTNGNQLFGKEALMQAGCNVSLVHTDFMIGDKKTAIVGFDKKGNKHQIMQNGLFVI